MRYIRMGERIKLSGPYHKKYLPPDTSSYHKGGQNET